MFRFTFIDRSVLSNAYVSGLSHPYFTQTPDYTVTALQNDGYSVSKVEWYGPQVGATGPLMNSTDVFLPGGYYCRIYLKPDDAYKFDDSSQLSVSIDTKISSYTSTVNIRKDDSGNYYGVIYFVVEQNSDIAPGILDFEWKDPSDTATNVNLGKAYLGTDSMDIPFAFKIKDLPRNMALADYTVYGSTYIQRDGESLYYTHTGDRVNLKDLATEPGRYYIYHELFLLDPEGNEIATEYVCYFVNVYTPIFIMDLSVEVDEPVAGLDAAGIEQNGLQLLRHLLAGGGPLLLALPTFSPPDGGITFATNLVNGVKQPDSGVKCLTPRQAGDLLGHSTSQITEIFYVKRDNSRLVGITDNFEL